SARESPLTASGSPTAALLQIVASPDRCPGLEITLGAESRPALERCKVIEVDGCSSRLTATRRGLRAQRCLHSTQAPAPPRSASPASPAPRRRAGRAGPAAWAPAPAGEEEAARTATPARSPARSPRPWARSSGAARG